MDMVFVLIQQILEMVAIMAVGFALIRTKMVDEHGAAQLSNVAMYVATPAVIIQSFAIDYDPEQLVGGLWVALFYAVTLVLTAALAAKACGSADRVGQFAVMFSNTGFVGIPIISGVLGSEYVFYVTMTMAVSTFALWTYGVYLVSGDVRQVSMHKIVTNPALISLIVGLALFLLPVHLPKIVTDVVSYLGNLNTGLAMLVLGINLGSTNLRLLISERRLYKTSLLRLVVVPLITMVLLFAMPTSRELRLVLLICQATPAAAAASMLAQIYGGDYRYGAGVVALSTLLSLVSMPVVLAVALQLF